jgi:hypothetical protein
MGDILSKDYVHFTGFLHTTHIFSVISEYNFPYLPTTAPDYIPKLFTTSPMTPQILGIITNMIPSSMASSSIIGYCFKKFIPALQRL